MGFPGFEKLATFHPAIISFFVIMSDVPHYLSQTAFSRGSSSATRNGLSTAIGVTAPLIYRFGGASAAAQFVAGATSPYWGTAAAVVSAAPLIYYGAEQAISAIGKMF